MKTKTEFLYLSIVILAGAIVVWGFYDIKQAKQAGAKLIEEKFSSDNALAEKPPVLVRAFKVKAVDFKDTLSVMGTITANTEISLKFEIAGVIDKIYFKEGDLIKKEI